MSTACNKLFTAEAMKVLPLAIKYGAMYKVDPYIILSYVKHESNFDPNTYNIGCRKKHPTTYATKCTAGLAQLPYRYYKKKINKPSDLLNPDTNIRLFADMLAFLIKKFGSVKRGLIAANWGYGRMLQHTKGNPQYKTISAKSIRYVNKILALREEYAKCKGALPLPQEKSYVFWVVSGLLVGSLWWLYLR